MQARFARLPLVALVASGILSLPFYGWALAYGPFRPDRIGPFFPMFAGAFVLYGVATWAVLHTASFPPWALSAIFGFAMLFSAMLLPMRPTLSDDMYRYVWDGRVQANGINPYRYKSDAEPLRPLRDDTIWARMNRKNAVTVYPPGAELLFAALWRVIPDSILLFKLFMVVCVLVCGWLLTRLLRILAEHPARVLIFLWNPLVLFEVAHSAHVDAVYVPLIVGAMLLRAAAPADRVDTRYEVGIGFLLGLAVLIKLHPAILLVPLWSVRDAYGCRRWRLALPLATGVTVTVGYALYIAPGVDTLGFLPSYSREFFNIGPLPMALSAWAEANRIPFYVPVNILMPVLVAVVSLYFLVVPARSAREAILRCVWPIGIYLLVSQNLFSWYVLWMLPLVAVRLQPGRWLGSKPNAALAWWLFSGLVALSYTLFITGYALPWVGWIEFVPVYLLLAAALYFNRKEAKLVTDA
jgi:alpha-1,6-mannosyltransferase